MKKIYYICLPFFFYPVYFLAANIIDSITGDQQLINWLYFDSWSVLLNTFLKDWLSALPVMYAIYYLLILPIEFLAGKFFNTSTPLIHIVSILLIAAVSYVAGFGSTGLLINAFAVFFIIVLSRYSQTLLFSRS